MFLTSGIDQLDKLHGHLNPGEIVFLSGDIRTLDLPHRFSVRGQLKAKEGGLNSSVLWLDGCNLFNPYRVGEFARELGLDSEEVLKKIYLSRAFTCYQMSSLALEKLWSAAEGFQAKLIIITGLPFLYLHSDIPKNEAVKAFKPVVKELGESEERENALILITSFFTERGGEILSDLRSISDVILNLRSKKREVEIWLEDHPDKPNDKVVLGLEAPEAVPLDEYTGGDRAG